MTNEDTNRGSEKDETKKSAFEQNIIKEDSDKSTDKEKVM